MKKSLISIRPLLPSLLILFFLNSLASASVDMGASFLSGSDAETGVSIIGDVNTKPARENNVVFSSTERLFFNLDYEIKGITEKKGNIFVVCRVNDGWYMKDDEDKWHRWDGKLNSLTPAQSGEIHKSEHITFTAGPDLPAGEYSIYTGLSMAGRLIYSKKAISFLIVGEADAMHRIESAEFLEAYLSKGVQDISQNHDMIYATTDTGAPVPVSDSSISGGKAETSLEFSTTNLQEEGVDEADIIKTDGRTLYRTGWCDEKRGMACILSYRIDESPAGSELMDSFEIKSGEPGNLYLASNREEGRPDILVHISGNRGDCYAYWADPGWWEAGKTRIEILDVNDPANMKQIDSIELDGVLISSRRIGEMLYLITRNTPQYPYPGPVPVPLTGQDKPAGNNQALPAQSLHDMIPSISINGNEKIPLVKPTDCFIPIYPPEIMPEPSIVTITAMSLNDPESFKSVSVAGSTDTVYVSSRSIYLATYTPRYIPMPRTGGVDVSTGANTESPVTEPLVPPIKDGDEGNKNVIMPPVEAQNFTELHRFALEGTGIRYAAAGKVPGDLGWEEDKRPFRMSEYNNALRIVTSSGDTWNNTSDTSLYILQEKKGGGDINALEITDSLTGLGKPGERLYASRFSGSRGFLVTFKVTDPLYILDLSEPHHPFVEGELYINGYSDYLHLLGDNYLLGIGKDAVPDTSSPDNNGRGAWYQGIKLSLFDITPGRKPSEVKSIVLGKRGTDSEALRDHHAVTILMSADNKSAGLAIPVSLADSMPPQTGFDPSSPRAYWDWTNTGLHFFRIELGNKGDIMETGRLITDYNNAGKEDYNGRDTYGDRSVIQGGAVHYIHNNRVYSSEMADIPN